MSVTEYRRQRAARMRPVKELGAEVARHLGPEWSVAPDVDRENPEEWGPELVGPGGLRLRIEPAGYADVVTKLEVRGVFPTGAPWRREHEAATTSIGVSLARGPEAIARDIVRRLLPGCVEFLARCYEHIERKDTEQRRRQSVVDELVALLPGSREASWNRSHGDSQQSEVFLELPGGQSAKVVVYSSGASAKLEVTSAAIETVVAMLTAIAPAQQGRPHLTAV